MCRLEVAPKPRPATALVIGLLLAQFLPSPAKAQPADGKSQPDRLGLGTVRVGATVEASVRVLIRGDDTTGIETKTSPPPFVRVTQTRTGTQTYGNLGTFIYYDVFLSLNTTRSGDFDGKLIVQLGEKRIEIPVTASILEKDREATSVLILETPFSRFSTSDATLFEPWLKLVNSARFDMHYLEVDPALPVLRDLELSDFDVILLGGTGILSARDEDFEKLNAFVESGGRVIVTANYFFRGTVESANKFVVPLGLKMSDIEPKIDNSLIELEEADIPRHKLTGGVRQLKFFRPSPVTVENPTKGTILVETPFDPQQGLVAVTRSGKGDVVVLGTSLWWNWIASEQESGVDNARLLKNLLSKASDDGKPARPRLK